MRDIIQKVHKQQAKQISSWYELFKHVWMKRTEKKPATTMSDTNRIEKKKLKRKTPLVAHHCAAPRYITFQIYSTLSLGQMWNDEYIPQTTKQRWKANQKKLLNAIRQFSHSIGNKSQSYLPATTSLSLSHLICSLSAIVISSSSRRKKIIIYARFERTIDHTRTRWYNLEMFRVLSGENLSNFHRFVFQFLLSFSTSMTFSHLIAS